MVNIKITAANDMVFFGLTLLQWLDNNPALQDIDVAIALAFIGACSSADVIRWHMTKNLIKFSNTESSIN